MKIIVLGGSRGTGALVVQKALAQGHEVTAFARQFSSLPLENPKLTKLVGDFHNKDSVAKAVVGYDAVIITASAATLKAAQSNPTYFSMGTAFAIDAMKKNGSKRLVVLSALGTGESRSILPWLTRKLLVDWLLKAPFADHARQEKMVQESGLPWVIARPGRLTNGPEKKQYVKKEGLVPVPSSISRADVADFLVEAATTSQWTGKIVHLGG